MTDATRKKLLIRAGVVSLLMNLNDWIDANQTDESQTSTSICYGNQETVVTVPTEAELQAIVDDLNAELILLMQAEKESTTGFVENVASLVSAVHAAQSAGLVEAEKSALQRRNEEALKNLEENHKANAILATVPEIIKQATIDKRKIATVTKLKWSDWTGHTNGNTLRPEQLVGAAAIVFFVCQTAGFNPMLTFGHDGGMESWYDIQIPLPLKIPPQ